MTTDSNMLQRRTAISKYARDRLAEFTPEELADIEAAKYKYADVDLTREHELDEQSLGAEPTPEELEEILHRMGKFKPEDQLNCGACGYPTCLEHAQAVFAGFAGTEMCLPHTIEQLRGGLPRPGVLAQVARRGQGGPRAQRPPRQHGPTRRRHRPRGQQSRWAPCCCTPTCSSKSAKTTPATARTSRPSSTRPTAASASSRACSTSPARAGCSASAPTWWS